MSDRLSRRFPAGGVLLAALVFAVSTATLIRAQAPAQAQPSITEAEVATRVEMAVRKAVAESEARQGAKLQQVIAQQKRYDVQMAQVEDSWRSIRRSSTLRQAS